MHSQGRDLKPDVPLLVLACFAMGWLVARAVTQSVTIDEADSYLAFATPDWAAHWYPSSGNHVLNTILMRILTSLFGLSHITLRGPALLGAALYIASIHGQCCWISGEAVIRWPLFVCLVYNPFIMDYLVAARGYSLALGFLAAALFLMTRGGESGMAASACAGLSLTANFSFAYVNAALLLTLLIWTWRRPASLKGYARAVAACLGPACLVAFLLCGSTILNFPRSQIYYGARSLGETWRSIVAASFDELNPFVVNPLWSKLLASLAPVLPYLFAALSILQAGSVAASKPLRAELRTRGRVGFGAVLLAISTLALAMHWLAFHILGILLPLARTAIFFAPLSVLMMGAGLASPGGAKFRRLLRVASMGVLFAGAAYFIGCLRLSYFKEWKFDADVREAFGVLQEIHCREGIREIPSHWKYSAALNFYRRYAGEDAIAEFTDRRPWPLDKRVYVLAYPDEQVFVEGQRLQIVYRGKRSDLVIAVRR